MLVLLMTKLKLDSLFKKKKKKKNLLKKILKKNF